MEKSPKTPIKQNIILYFIIISTKIENFSELFRKIAHIITLFHLCSPIQEEK